MAHGFFCTSLAMRQFPFCITVRVIFPQNNAIFASFNNLFVINHSTKIMSKHYKCVHK